MSSFSYLKPSTINYWKATQKNGLQSKIVVTDVDKEETMFSIVYDCKYITS